MFYPLLQNEADIFNAVEQLAAEDLRIMQRVGRPLDLLEYGVWYESALAGRNHYANIEDVIRRGVGVCHDFTAWLLAFLRYTGVRCEPLLLKQTPTLFHVLAVADVGGAWVALDPSKWKGMSYA